MAYEYRTSFTAADRADREETIVDGRFSSDGSQYLADSEKINLGTDEDFQIYHDGDNGYITNTKGEFQIGNSDPGNVVFIQPKVGENSIKAIHNGSVSLYWGGAGPKFETAENGVEITGTGLITSTVNTALNLNKTSGQVNLAFQVDGSTKWNIGTDELGGGTDDFFIYHAGTGQSPLKFSATDNATFAGDISYPKSTPDGEITVEVTEDPLAAGAWKTIIPAGTSGIVDGATYIVSIYWHYGDSGQAQPWHVTGGMVWVPTNSNDTSPEYGNEIQLSSSIHGDPSNNIACHLKVRSVTGYMVQSGLQVAPVGWSPANSSDFIVKYKRIM